MINVVAAILKNKNGEVLIAKRKKGKILGGYWEFPGGKVEINETPEYSLIRELKEEMNIEIKVNSFVGESIYNYDRGTIRLLGYMAEIVSGEVRLVDHDECKWVELEELKSYKLAPADIPLIELLC